MDEKAFQRYLATGDYSPSADAAPMSLAAHDRLYHHGLFTGGRCLYRSNQSADDPADALLVNAAVPYSPASPHGGSAPTPQGGDNLAAEIEAVKSLYTKPDGTHSKSWLRAPNGKPSNLSPDQWCLVRTPTFKKWFGDWEKQAEVDSAIDFLRSTPPVASLLGDEFPPGGEKLTESVPAYWKKHNEGIAVSPDFGEVKLDKEGVKSDIGHGISRLKAIAFAAVPAVIEKGIAYNRAKNWKGREWDSAVIGAPIKIGDDDYYCEVVIQRLPNRQGFYLHDVELKAKSEAAFKTPTQGSAAPLSKLIVAKLLAEVNPATVSKIVDSNGEPRTMFHGTNSRFSKFDPKYIRSTNWGKGFYFTSSEDDARHYGSIVMPCFLKSDNPLDLTTGENDAEYNKWYGKKKSPYDGYFTDISGKLMCVVPKSSQIFIVPDNPKKSDALNLRAIADAVLAEDAAINPDFESKHPRGNSANKGQFRKSEKTLAKLDEADAAVASAPAPQGGGSPSAEYAAVEAKYKGTPQWMKAPNGEPTNLSERQWVQVRTPSFKAWFGDWENDPEHASKVTDANGEPKIVYHATPEKFTAFDKDKIFSTNSATFLEGFYFSDRRPNTPWNVMEVFLNLRKPLELDIDKATFDTVGAQEIADAIHRAGSMHPDLDEYLVSNGIVEADDSGSYDDSLREWYAQHWDPDGLIVLNTQYDSHKDEFVAFEPNQIKSATSNSGYFSPDKESILDSAPVSNPQN